MAALALVEHGRAVHGDVEVGWPEDQVDQDLTGDRGQLRLREPRPRLGLRPLLAESDPHGVQEWQDRECEQDDEGRDAGEDGSKDAGD